MIILFIVIINIVIVIVIIIIIIIILIDIVIGTNWFRNDSKLALRITHSSNISFASTSFQRLQCATLQKENERLRNVLDDKDRIRMDSVRRQGTRFLLLIIEN